MLFPHFFELYLHSIYKYNSIRTQIESLKFTMNNIDLEKLKKALPTNYIDTLSERTGFSRSYVCQVINGKGRKNLNIIDAAILLAKEEKAIREERQMQINSL